MAGRVEGVLRSRRSATRGDNRLNCCVYSFNLPKAGMSDRKPLIACVCGARPNFMYIGPIVDALDRDGDFVKLMADSGLCLQIREASRRRPRC